MRLYMYQADMLREIMGDEFDDIFRRFFDQFEVNHDAEARRQRTTAEDETAVENAIKCHGCGVYFVPHLRYVRWKSGHPKAKQLCEPCWK